MKRDFNTWLATFRDSISTYDYYTDFNKIYQNVDSIKVELNILNSLIASKNIKQDFVKLLKDYPNILKCIPILLAKRESEIYASDTEGSFSYKFSKANQSIEQYCYFMEQTGLFELLEKRIVNNLVDYVTGVETGLDSNARKNRGGKLMENLLEAYIQKAGFVKDETYFKEMRTPDMQKKFSIDLSAISNAGQTVKQFDFVLHKNGVIYGVETNFYTGGGSKLNETARSYKTIAVEARQIPNFRFVWVTDGKGWHDAKNNLRETFDVMEYIYNIQDLDNSVLSTI